MKKENELVVTGILFIAMAYGISRFSYGLLLPYFNDEIGMTNQISGIISSLSYLTYIVGLLSVYTVFKNFQPRTMLIFSGCISLYGLYLLSVTEHVMIFGLGVVMMGYSAGIATAPFGPIVKEKISVGYQDRSNAWINTGIGLGLMLIGGIVWLLAPDWRLCYMIFLILSLTIVYFNYRKLPRVEMSHLNYQLKLNQTFYGRKLIISTLLLGMGTSAYWTYFQTYIFQTHHKELAPLFWIILGIGGLFGGFAGESKERFGLTRVQIGTALLLGLADISLVLSENFFLMLFSTFLFGLVYVFAMRVYAFWSARLYVTYPSLGVIVTFSTLAIGQFMGTFASGFILEAVGYKYLFIIYGTFSMLSIFFRPLAEEIEEEIEEG